MTFDYDVTVIGAGLAGLEAARQIAQRGHRVLLVDVKPALERAIHTTGIFVRRTLTDFSLPEDCLGPPVGRVVLRAPSGRADVLESTHDEFRVGRMGRLYQRLLADCIAAGVEWMGGTRMASACPIAGGSAVWLEQGARRWRVRTRLLVGADGAVSRVARALGLEENREWIVGVEDVYGAVEAEGPPSFDCWLDPGIAPGYIGWWVHDGEASHVGVAGYASAFEPVAALSELRRRVSRMCDLSRARRVERRGGRIPVNGVLRRIACERGLLVGDAAGAVSPLTAGGLDGCLRLTAHAARLVCSTLEEGSAAPLEDYRGDVFRTRLVSRLLLRRVISRVHSPTLAEAVCLALRHPPLRALARHVFFGRGSFPDIADQPFSTPMGRSRATFRPIPARSTTSTTSATSL